MGKYLNLNGDSGVAGYEIGTSSIKVYFNDGSEYLYNQIKPGVTHVEIMKKLAIAGRGLNSYINSNVKYLYFQQLK